MTRLFIYYPDRDQNKKIFAEHYVLVFTIFRYIRYLNNYIDKKPFCHY